jgi:uncharacterized membrane protein
LQRRKGGSDRSWLWQLLGLTLLAAGIRFYHLGVPALWTDEAYSLWFAKLTLPDMWRWIVRIDPHPPLYYILLHFWSILGTQEGVLRSLSALCGTLTIPLIYMLGRTISGHRLGLLVAIFLTFSPFNLWYDQEARMYPLLALSATTAMLGLAVLLRWPRSATLLTVRRTSGHSLGRGALLLGGAWLAYVVGTAAALWSQHSAILLFVMANMAVLGAQAHLRLKPSFTYSWLGAQLIIVALWSPVLPVLVGQVLAGNPQAVPPLGAGVLLSALTADVVFPVALLSSSPIARGLVILGTELVGVLIGLGLWAWRRQLRWIFFTLPLWLGPALAESVVSLFWQTVFVPRTLIWTMTPFYLILARGILRVRPISVRGTVLIFFLAIDVVALGLYFTRIPKWEEWDRAAAYVAARVHFGDIIIFHDNLMQLPFNYYFQRHHCEIDEAGVPVDFPGGKAREPAITSGDLPRLRTLVAAHPRVWLVYSHEWFTDPQETVPPALARLGRLADLQTFVGVPKIRIYLFEIGRPRVEIHPGQAADGRICL